MRTLRLKTSARRGESDSARARAVPSRQDPGTIPPVTVFRDDTFSCLLAGGSTPLLYHHENPPAPVRPGHRPARRSGDMQLDGHRDAEPGEPRLLPRRCITGRDPPRVVPGRAGFLGDHTAWQAVSNARRARETAKALEAQRALVEQVEVSRFNELRLALVSEFERFSSTLTATRDALRVEIHDSGNSIAAMLAEIDDRAKTTEPVSRGRLP